MNRTLSLTATAAALLALAACSSSAKTASSDSAPSGASTTATTTAATPASLNATQVMAKLTTLVPQAKQGLIVTAANDSNQLLGRPNEYTSEVYFTDSRVPASDTQFDKPGDVDLGGAIEVFPNAALAAGRVKYIQALGAVPMFAEYDYQAGDAVIRVSHYLTPAQAADYQKAAKTLG